MQTALDLEKHVNQALIDLHKIAEKHGDNQVTQSLLPVRVLSHIFSAISQT